MLQALVDDASMVVEISDDAPVNEGEEQQVVRDVWVKVSPPVYIRVIPPPSILAQHRSTSTNLSSRQSSALSSFFHRQQNSNSHPTERKRRTAWEAVESFMSSWTRLVGDPIMSKWIVVLLAISISLNGFLLKGIALGLPVVGRTSAKGGVRFEEDEEEKKEKKAIKEKETKVQAPLSDSSTTPTASSPVIATATTSVPPPLFVPVPKPAAPAAIPTFTLEDVDRKLQAAAAAASSLNTPPLTDSGIHTPPSNDTVRTLEECIDIFENGPRPLSLSLKMLNDEEIILLSQNGKIAMYALEKVLGMDELERAVRIRRALVCEYLFRVLLL